MKYIIRVASLYLKLEFLNEKKKVTYDVMAKLLIELSLE